MAKKSFRGRPKKKSASKGVPKNPNDMMAQIQQMQAGMAQTQEQLADELVTVTAGGGAIEITITGHQRIKDIKIDPELLDPEEVDMVQDMLIAAVNQAIEKSQTMAAERMEGMTGGMGLGDLLGGMM